MRKQAKIATLLAVILAVSLFAAYTTRNFSEILGDTLPATCLIGEQIWLTTEQPGEELFGCTDDAPVTWTRLGSQHSYGQLYIDSALGITVNLAKTGTYYLLTT